MTLLKTARAYGLGIVLATQNPADIDYKGLSNVGTWFVGRLTTERDRTRLLEGMADESVEGTTRAELGRLIAGLKQREFVSRSVRGGQPTLFTTRFCMSYLAGPLTREQIRDLVADQRPQVSVAPPVVAAPGLWQRFPRRLWWQYLNQNLGSVLVPPPTPSGIVVSYLPGVPGQRYQPVLSGFLSVFYENAKLGISKTEQVTRFTSLGVPVIPVDWNNVLDMDYTLDDFEQNPPVGATYRGIAG